MLIFIVWLLSAFCLNAPLLACDKAQELELRPTVYDLIQACRQEDHRAVLDYFNRVTPALKKFEFDHFRQAFYACARQELSRVGQARDIKDIFSSTHFLMWWLESSEHIIGYRTEWIGKLIQEYTRWSTEEINSQADRLLVQLVRLMAPYGIRLYPPTTPNPLNRKSILQDVVRQQQDTEVGDWHPLIKSIILADTFCRDKKDFDALLDATESKFLPAALYYAALTADVYATLKLLIKGASPFAVCPHTGQHVLGALEKRMACMKTFIFDKDHAWLYQDLHACASLICKSTHKKSTLLASLFPKKHVAYLSMLLQKDILVHPHIRNSEDHVTYLLGHDMGRQLYTEYSQLYLQG